MYSYIAIEHLRYGYPTKELNLELYLILINFNLERYLIQLLENFQVCLELGHVNLLLQVQIL